MFDTGTPYEGRDLRDVLSRLVGEGNEQLRFLAVDAFFAPQGDRWSPAEHIRHLRKSTAPVAQALRLPRLILQFRFGRVRAPSRDFVTLRTTYLEKLATGGKAGGFAPSRQAPPVDPTGRRIEILEAWSKSVSQLATAIDRWPEAALDRAYLPHPLLGRLTVREMLEFTVYHTSHHLTLIESRLKAVT